MRPLSNRLHQLILFSWAFALLSLIGGLIAQGAALFHKADDPTIPQGSNFYHYTFVRFEPFALYVGILFFIGLCLYLVRRQAASAKIPGLLKLKSLPIIVAFGVLAATGVGRFAVYQNFDLCIDECLADFEAGILAHHHLVATVPVEWRDYQNAMKVPYENYNGDQGYWASGFLPGYAFLDYLLEEVNLGWALGPILAASSILLVASVARRIFPDNPTLAGGIAVLLLAFSPQFLAMGMTKFAWTAHLCGSLLWLWLFTHPNRFLFLLTPILGALMIGLHQPHVHPLMAAPFVLRLLFACRWRDFTWFCFWYLLGAWAWYQVFSILRPTAFGPGGDLSNFAHTSSFSLAPILVSLIFATFHAITLLAWTTPVMGPFLGMMLLTWKRQPAVIQDSLAAVCLTFGFYLFFPHPQGHGWGYRYLHSVYGLLALVSMAGAMTLVRDGWKSQMARALLASVVFSLLVQIPYRIYEIRTMVRPLALTWNYISRQSCDFVVINTSDFWYSWDLIRNDPWLGKRPLVFNGHKLTPEQLAGLRSRGTVLVVGANEVKGFGVIISDPKKSDMSPY